MKCIRDLTEGFTKRYPIHRLVYYETHSDIYELITREKGMEPTMENKFD